MDINDLLKMAAASAEKHGTKRYGSPGEALDAMKAFLQTKSDINVYDRVDLNEAGKLRYSIPREGMVAMAAEFFEEPLVDEDGDLADMRILVSFGENAFKFYNVDSRFYKKVNEKRNVFSFKK